MRRAPGLVAGGLVIVLFLLMVPAADRAPRATGPPRSAATRAVEKPVGRRIGDRTFPSVFQAWNPAQNLAEERLRTVARHDLVFHGVGLFGLQWDRRPVGLATGFTAESIRRGRAFRRRMLAMNPNLVLLAEVRYRDAWGGFLPADHRWWRRKNGKRIVGWKEGGFYILDYTNPQYRRHVAARCKAVMDSGAVDGVMLDWWIDDADRLALIQGIRRAIGGKPLVLVNTNDRTAPKTARYVNGFFMECYRSKTVADWRRIAETLAWAERHCRAPRINCLETWYARSRRDLSRMRATTALSLTRSDGYCLFGDPNPLPTPDHLHDWYPFWDKSLGKPTGAGRQRPDAAWQREFEKGSVVYNPMGNRPVTVTFPEPHTSRATGERSRTHVLGPLDGDIYLK
jgi:hypothetical protein